MDITLTLECNNNCIFCPRKDYLNFLVCKSEKEIAKELKKISEKSEKVVLTGGEVTVFPDIFKILKLCQNKFKGIEIITNGRKLKDKKFLNKFISFGVNNFAVSIYSFSDKIHDAITREKGSCQETKQGIINLVEAVRLNPAKGIQARVNITLGSANVSSVIEAIKKTNQLGIKDFTLAEEIVLSKKEKALKLEQIKRLLDSVSKEKIGDIRILLKGFPTCLAKNYVSSFIKLEPYRLESALNKGSRTQKYLKKFQDNFKKLKKCSSCVINKQCLGVQKYYKDSNRFVKPISASQMTKAKAKAIK